MLTVHNKFLLFSFVCFLYLFIKGSRVKTSLKESWAYRETKRSVCAVNLLTCFPGADVVRCAGLMLQLSLHKLTHGQSSQRASLHLTVLSCGSHTEQNHALDTSCHTSITDTSMVGMVTWCEWGGHWREIAFFFPKMKNSTCSGLKKI